MLEIVCLTGLISTFIIRLIEKLGLREKGQIYAPKLISKMLNCNFCFAFWTNCTITLIFFFINTQSQYWYLIPLFSTPLTHKLL
jgi:hypothetical protein